MSKSTWKQMTAEEKAEYNRKRRERRALKKANKTAPTEKKARKALKKMQKKDAKATPEERLMKAIYGKDCPPPRMRSAIENHLSATRMAVVDDMDDVRNTIVKAMEDLASLLGRVFPTFEGVVFDVKHVAPKAKKSAKKAKK